MALALNCAALSTGFAHALWIETNNVGAIGKAREIEIYYGEYAAKEFKPTDKWYSDVNTFVLWLTLPDGTKKQIEYKTVDKAFAATFTPDKEGIYTLTVGHSAREIDGAMVYQFNVSAVVIVKGSSVGSSNAVANNELYLEPGKDAAGKVGVVKAFYKGKPMAKITITYQLQADGAKILKQTKTVC